MARTSPSYSLEESTRYPSTLSSSHALTLGVASADAQDSSFELSGMNVAAPKVGRGMTSRVRIARDLIHLVPFPAVSVTLADSLMGERTGCLAMPS